MPKVKGCVKTDKGAVALSDYELGDPEPGQALVKMTLSTICGSDIHIVDDIDEVPAGMPMGHEAVGVIEAVGDGVDRFKPGDRVVTCCLSSCGSCEQCVDGNLNVCQTFGAPMNLLFGCQGEAYMVNGADQSMAIIPDGMSDRQAIFGADIMSTGFGAIERAGDVEGKTVAIFAQGPVGLCVTAAAKFYKAGRIITVESIPERVAMSRQLGADEVFDPDTAVESILEATGGVGAHVAVEALGKQVTFGNCLASTRMGGTISSVGVYGGIEELTVPTDGNFMHRNIVTTLCPAGRERLEDLLGIIESGEVDLEPLLTHEHSLDDIVASYDTFRAHDDGVLKIAIS